MQFTEHSWQCQQGNLHCYQMKDLGDKNRDIKTQR